MRLDHIAYRVKNRDKTVSFFIEAFGYHFQAEFEIDFGNNDKALCIALEPPEKTSKDLPFHCVNPDGVDYHLAPEIFVSEGTPGSIVWNWVQSRQGLGGIHHMAYEVDDVEAQRKLWIEKGLADFTSDKPFHCDDLTQIFSKPHSLSNTIYEFIERKGHGFCQSNVKSLMLSTAKLDGNMS